LNKETPGRHRLWPHSIRWRLQLWLASLLICVLTGFGITVYQRQRVNRFHQIDAELEIRVAALSRVVREYYRDGPRDPHEHRRHEHRPPPDGPPPDGPPPDRPRPPMPGKVDELPLSSEAAVLFGEGGGAYYFLVWYRDGTVLKRSSNAPAGVPEPRRFEQDTLPHFRTRQAFREAVHCSGLGECALAGRSVQADLQAMQSFGWALLAAGASVLVLGLGVGWWLTTRAIRPIEQISVAATRIAGGNLSERIPGVDRDDELGRLAGVLNSTFARLESAFVEQQQFTADAAHELRTPVAVIISETQTTLARERTAAEYRETVKADLDTAQQMRRLTESLLELAQFDSAADGLNQGDVDLAERARVCVERIAPLAAQARIRIHAGFAPAPALGNPDRLDKLIANLLTNAIYYNKPEGEVRITTFTDAGTAVLTVADTGIGIPAADLPHIFGRFYRVDRARSRAEGHIGLGLAICKAIVDALRGTIDAASTLNTGTTFTVRLPAKVIIEQ